MAQHLVIPIHAERRCTGVPPLQVVEPHFEGTPERVQAIVTALKPLVDAEFGDDLPPGAWLRGLRLVEGEAVLTIAPDLACRGHAVAELAFDVMRRLLPDTDIFVGESPSA